MVVVRKLLWMITVWFAQKKHKWQCLYLSIPYATSIYPMRVRLTL